MTHFVIFLALIVMGIFARDCDVGCCLEIGSPGKACHDLSKSLLGDWFSRKSDGCFSGLEEHLGPVWFVDGFRIRIWI
ncbi:hypothetical protein Tco_1259247 [Tanacetum coccineum]